MAPRTDSLPLNDPSPMGVRRPLTLINGKNNESDNDTGVSFEDGAMKIDHGDGTTTIDFEPDKQVGDGETGFYENLAKRMDDGELGGIASELLDSISRDDQSRQEWLATRALGIGLLGAKLEKPRSDAGTSSAPLEGMSTVRHPLLMEATVTFQATARAELLPSTGPVKVRNDAPPPPMVNTDTSAAADIADSLANKDDLSQALEKDMNHYLTSTATEYIPDTDRMLFYIGFGGDGFKKVYNCPLRRRPVSESIDAEDLIVSNHATDLHSSGRITHRIRMRKSVLRRMQIIGSYRDVELHAPSAPMGDPVRKKKEDIEGVHTNVQKPEDRDYEIYETYCELDLDQFAAKQFKGKGLPLPYRVTLEKESRQILDIRRNWKEDDKQCLAKRFIVQFPFIRGLGFYGLGFIHLLGNTTNALTAAWREMLDAGMFSSFPGFIYAKGAGRQNSNQFRVPPGGGVGLDIGAQQNIRDAIMPLPYKEPGAAFTQFITHVEDVGKRLAATGNITVGEGKQDAPVGTTLALIEQASKVIDSAHKRLHAAQAEEFKLLKERFLDDPEAFWRHNKASARQWKKDQFVAALESCELVPVADPNNPTSLHRLAKALAVINLAQSTPALYDMQAVHMRALHFADIDPAGLFAPSPAPPPPDPRVMAVQAKAQAEQGKLQDSAADRQSKEKIAALGLQKEMIIHAHDMQMNQASASQELALERAKASQDMQVDAAQAQHEMRGGIIKSAAEIQMEHENHQAGMRRDQQEWEAKHQRETAEHRQKMEHAAEEHRTKLQHAHDLNMAKIETAKQLAKVKKPASDKKP